MKEIRGFTLTEILVTVTIVGVLAAIGVPTYQNYVIKARIVEAFEFADAARTRIMVAAAVTGNLDSRVLYQGNNAQNGAAGSVQTLQWVKGEPGTGLKGYILADIHLPAVNPTPPSTVSAFALEWRDNGQWHCVNAATHPAAGAKTPALDAKYLPASCNETSGPLGRPGATKTCPAGQEKVTVQLNGADSDACANACPAGQGRDQANPLNCVAPATTAKPAIPPTVPASTPPAASAPQPQAAPSAPAAGGTPPEGTQRRPGDASRGDINCHVCDPSVPDLCELVTSQTTCAYPNNFCITFVDNHEDGTRTVNRECGNYERAHREWYQGTSDDDKCRERIDVTTLLDFRCTFACETDNCNASGGSLRPAEDSLYTLR